MRGKRIFEELTTLGKRKPERKGRNVNLIALRNECLLARYYYYAHMKRKTYDDLLQLLMMEFFVAPATITYLVQDHTDHLLQLKQKAPGRYYFTSRWPHLRW